MTLPRDRWVFRIERFAACLGFASVDHIVRCVTACLCELPVPGVQVLDLAIDTGVFEPVVVKAGGGGSGGVIVVSTVVVGARRAGIEPVRAVACVIVDGAFGGKLSAVDARLGGGFTT